MGSLCCFEWSIACWRCVFDGIGKLLQYHIGLYVVVPLQKKKLLCFCLLLLFWLLFSWFVCWLFAVPLSLPKQQSCPNFTIAKNIAPAPGMNTFCVDDDDYDGGASGWFIQYCNCNFFPSAFVLPTDTLLSCSFLFGSG